MPFTRHNQAVSTEPQIVREPSNNRYALLEDALANEKHIKFVPQDYDYKLQLEIREDKARKEKEWEQTKRRLEAKMEADMTKKKEWERQ